MKIGDHQTLSGHLGSPIFSFRPTFFCLLFFKKREKNSNRFLYSS